MITALEVKVSSKGQIVIPRDVREKLGLKPGDKVKLEIVEGKRAVLQPAVKPPEGIFVKAGDRLVEENLQETRENDERKIGDLLKSLGVKN